MFGKFFDGVGHALEAALHEELQLVQIGLSESVTCQRYMEPSAIVLISMKNVLAPCVGDCTTAWSARACSFSPATCSESDIDGWCLLGYVKGPCGPVELGETGQICF